MARYPGTGLLGAVGVFDDERADLAVVVAGPDHHDAGDGTVADPALLAGQHPFVAIPLRPGLQRHDVGAVVRFGERERTEHLTGCHPGQVLGALLRGAQHGDGGHRQSGMHGIEGRDAAVAAGQFGGDHALGEKGQPGAAVTDDGRAGDAEPAVALATSSTGNSARSQ